MEDCAVERNAPAFVKWVKEKFNLLASSEDGEKSIRLLRPPYFMREVYPLHLLVGLWYGGREDVTCRWCPGNGPFDATITDLSQSPPVVWRIELTIAVDEKDIWRMRMLNENGHVDATGPVWKEGTDRKGSRISTRLEAVPNMAHEERLILEAARRKKDKCVGKDVVLVIAFYDGTLCSEYARKGMERFAKEKLTSLRLNVGKFVLLGMSRLTLIEVPAAKADLAS